MKKELQKNLSFVLFVMAVFFAGMSLTVFQEYIWMACIAGVVLLATAVLFVLSREKEAPSPTEKTSDILLADRMAELMRGNEKAEKGVYIAVKKQHEAMEAGLAALEEKLTELIKAQENAVKTLVMYNKENAKQIALSEREELGRLREEIKQSQQGGGAAGSGSAVVEAVREMSHRLYEEIHENGEAVLSELGTTVDCLEEIKQIIDRLNEGGAVMVAGSIAASQQTEAVLTEDFFADVPETEEPVVEEEPEHPFFAPEDPEEAEATIWTDEQAEALLKEREAAMQAEQSEEMTEEEPADKKPEDALASSGVDLSDPNRTLSADDIAALIAAMGN